MLTDTDPYSLQSRFIQYVASVLILIFGVTFVWLVEEYLWPCMKAIFHGVIKAIRSFLWLVILQMTLPYLLQAFVTWLKVDMNLTHATPFHWILWAIDTLLVGRTTTHSLIHAWCPSNLLNCSMFLLN